MEARTERQPSPGLRRPSGRTALRALRVGGSPRPAPSGVSQTSPMRSAPFQQTSVHRRAEDGDARVSPEGEEIVIAADKVVRVACHGQREHVIVRRVTDHGRDRGHAGQYDGSSRQQATEFGNVLRGHVVAAADVRQEERARDLVQDHGRNDQVEFPQSPAD